MSNPKSNNCSKCPSPATFTNPEDLCDEHWVDWWMEGYEEDGYGAAELHQIRQECLDNIESSRSIQNKRSSVRYEHREELDDSPR